MSQLEHPNITLGTAGHVDHGKTELIKFLTGCDTDRLKEEKERGLSIDLGFAPCTVGRKQVGIVDVPGHEDFIRTMVAGASCMDGVILIVAADDGVMPQTREHLEIVGLLGVEHGVVALTKADLVDEEGLELARLELREFLRGTFLEDAPIVPTCNLTGDGFEDFYRALAGLVDSIEPKSTEGVFRLPVDRAFSVKGYGTVVAGVPVSGSARTGDDLVLLPQGRAGAVRGIEVYGRPAELVVAGQCAALNVRGWDHREIRRGDVVAAPGCFSTSEWLAAELELLPHEGVVARNGDRVKLHAGTSQVGAALYLMKGNELPVGQGALVQFQLADPLVTGPGDRFIVRSLTPPRTIGGGRIIEGIQRRLRRTKPEVRADLAERAAAVRSPKDFVAYCVKTAHGFAAAVDELAHRSKCTPVQIERWLAELAEEGRVLSVGPARYMHSETLSELHGSIEGTLQDYHSRRPASVGMVVEELGRAAGIASDLAGDVAALLVERGVLSREGSRFALAGHAPTMTPRQEHALAAVESALREGGFHPPSVEEICSRTGLPADDAAWAADVLKERGDAVEVADGLLFHQEAVERARTILTDHIRAEGELESVRFKYLLDTTRKYAIPLLDYFDRVGVTSRRGYTRFLRDAPRTRRD